MSPVPAQVIVRPATPTDQPDLRRAIVELQNHERLMHVTRLPGDEIADAYLDWLLRQAKARAIEYVAERGGGFAGFAAGWIELTENIGETHDSNRFGYVSALCVMPPFRGQRIAARLLKAIEQHLRRSGISRLRINALAANVSAQASYTHAGFAPYEICYEKLISD